MFDENRYPSPKALVNLFNDFIFDESTYFLRPLADAHLADATSGTDLKFIVDNFKGSERTEALKGCDYFGSDFLLIYNNFPHDIT
jgi:hypothetical protein